LGARRLILLATVLLALASCSSTPVAFPPLGGYSGSISGTTPDYHVDLQAGWLGWDVSKPQCSKPLPGQRSFAIVGVNGDLPTEQNPCFADQASWAAHSGPPLFYVNAANPAGLGTPTWPHSGGTSTEACTGDESSACSYQYGKDRITDDLNIIGRYLRPGSVILISVEKEFSWQDGKQTKASNTAAVRGMADAIRDAYAIPGIYSTGDDWKLLMDPIGSGDSLHGLPVWWRGARNLDEATANCKQTAFTGGKVIISQIPGEATQSGFDEDVAC
jgi:hypothetical protein